MTLKARSSAAETRRLLIDLVLSIWLVTLAASRAMGGAPDGEPAHRPGSGCGYFTRPPVERNNDLDVPSVRLNYHSKNTVVCHTKVRYRCDATHWTKIGECTDSDPRQAWAIEGGQEPTGTAPAGGDDEGPGPSAPDQGDPGPPSPFSSNDSPFGGSQGVPSPFGSSFGVNRLPGGESLGPSVSPAGRAGGGTRGVSPAAAGGAGLSDGDIVLSRECIRQSDSASEEWQRSCFTQDTTGSICLTYRRLQRCTEDLIRRVRALPCPPEIIRSSIDAMNDVVTQSRTSARQVCTN